MLPSKPPSPFRLNPLAFPTETNMRFLLLVIAAAGTIIGLSDFAIYVLVQYLPIADQVAKLIATSSAFLVALLVFVLAHRHAMQAARNLIAGERWTPFPPMRDDPLEQASFERMREHVNQVLAELPDVAAQRPKFYWNDTSPDNQHPVGMTFGYHHSQYVCLNEGLHAAFISTPRADGFNSVLLHELGHLANRDVSRTTFSIALGRAFTQTALILALISNGYLIFQLIRRFLLGTTDQNDVAAMSIISQLAIGTVLVIVLIEMIRASILRSREYDADERARQWLGSEAPLLDLFNRSSISVSPSPMMTSLSLRQLFRTYLAPLHPPHATRCDALINARRLFKVELWPAFIAGLLGVFPVSAIGLVLQVFSSPQVSSIVTVQTAFAISVVLIVALFVGCFIVPLVGIVGVMMQRAAVADRIEQVGSRLLPLRRVVALAFLVSIGIVLGGSLTPTPGMLTFQNHDWLLAPIFMSIWSGSLSICLLPLRWFAARAYSSHVSARPPVLRRRCISVLAALAITPVALFTMLGQGAAMAEVIDSTSPEFIFGFLIGWLISISLALIIWGCGSLLVWLAGWFGPTTCPVCGKIENSTHAMIYCTQCGYTLMAWMVTPPPVPLPHILPLAITPSSDIPPPL